MPEIKDPKMRPSQLAKIDLSKLKLKDLSFDFLSKIIENSSKSKDSEKKYTQTLNHNGNTYVLSDMEGSAGAFYCLFEIYFNKPFNKDNDVIVLNGDFFGRGDGSNTFILLCLLNYLTEQGVKFAATRGNHEIYSTNDKFRLLIGEDNWTRYINLCEKLPVELVYSSGKSGVFISHASPYHKDLLIDSKDKLSCPPEYYNCWNDISFEESVYSLSERDKTSEKRTLNTYGAFEFFALAFLKKWKNNLINISFIFGHRRPEYNHLLDQYSSFIERYLKVYTHHSSDEHDTRPTFIKITRDGKCAIYDMNGTDVTEEAEKQLNPSLFDHCLEEGDFHNIDGLYEDFVKQNYKKLCVEYIELSLLCQLRDPRLFNAAINNLTLQILTVVFLKRVKKEQIKHIAINADSPVKIYIQRKIDLLSMFLPQNFINYTAELFMREYRSYNFHIMNNEQIFKFNIDLMMVLSVDKDESNDKKNVQNLRYLLAGIFATSSLAKKEAYLEMVREAITGQCFHELGFDDFWKVSKYYSMTPCCLGNLVSYNKSQQALIAEGTEQLTRLYN